MAADASRSTTGGSAADSYLGSLISLTSKSEIRYEGILFNIDTDEANIGLRNVRSFGTEGRRKDSPQVPAIDKVYEYIVFRGSDIKDLQVKSSPPPVQTAPPPPVHNDPAIIQSHYNPPNAPSSMPTAPLAQTQIQTAVSPSDFGTQIPRAVNHNSTPLYPPGGNSASWNPPPPPTTNNSGLPGSMYWPGYYGGPSASFQQPQPQQSLLRPVQGLPMPPSLQPSLTQHPIHYPTFTSNISVSQSTEFPPPLLQPIVSSTVSMSQTVLPVQSSALNVGPSNLVPSKPPVVSQTNMPLVSSSPALSNVLDKSSLPTLIPNQLKPISSSPMPFNSLSEPLSSIGGLSGSPALVTPGQFFNPGATIPPTSQTAQKDVEVVQVSSLGSLPQTPAVMTAPVQAPTEQTQAPLLPLPSPVNSKVNGVFYHARYGNRGGRGRGRGNEFSRSAPNYTEDFDFEAMNEKFKKDEVWGHLGKSNSKADDELDLQDENNGDVLGADKKQPVYKKDDFFDTLSCNALDRESRSARPRFSEQIRLDTETFGDLPRNRGYRGGRGPPRGGRGPPRGGRGPPRGGQSRGGYEGRGYGNSNTNGRGGYEGRGYGNSNTNGRGGYQGRGSGNSNSNGYGGRGRGQSVYRAI